MVEGRCMKCKKQVEMKDPVITKTARGGYMAKGKCPIHSETTVCAMMSKENAEKAMQSGEAKKGF
jgi:phosphoribosylaminoimidazole carboxylase (NCAIR synthetase)